MTKVRMLVAVVATLLLAAGYLASQAAYFGGNAVEYAARIDAPPIILLSMAILVGALILFFIPEREEPEP